MRLSLLILINLFIASCCSDDEVPAHINNLYSEQAKLRNEAALALARCGKKAEKAVPRLSALLYDHNIGVQSSAAYALRKIDTPSARKVLERVEAARRRN